MCHEGQLVQEQRGHKRRVQDVHRSSTRMYKEKDLPISCKMRSPRPKSRHGSRASSMERSCDYEDPYAGRPA